MKSVRIVFSPKQTLVIPLARFDILQGLFYKLLSYDEELATELHDKIQVRGRQYKYCCFTDLSGRRRLSGKAHVFTGPIEWEIRSMDDRVPETVANRLRYNSCFNLSGTDCYIERLELISTETFCNNVVFRMATPVTVYTTEESGYRHFWKPSEDEFSELVERNLLYKYQRYYDTEADIPIEFRPVRASAKDKVVTKYKDTYITGYYGTYELEAPLSVIDLAYYAGIGNKNAQGFGTIRDLKEIR